MYLDLFFNVYAFKLDVIDTVVNHAQRSLIRSTLAEATVNGEPTPR